MSDAIYIYTTEKQFTITKPKLGAVNRQNELNFHMQAQTKVHLGEYSRQLVPFALIYMVEKEIL